MSRWRRAALVLAVVAFGLAGLGPVDWLPDGFPAQTARTALFWLGAVCFLAMAWGWGGT